MKIVLGMAILLLCSGCATRTITLIYYPHIQDPSRFPEIARRECARYAQDAQPSGAGAADFGRLTQTFTCVPR